MGGLHRKKVSDIMSFKAHKMVQKKYLVVSISVNSRKCSCVSTLALEHLFK